jgi:TRAP-type transport system periplasmic protein
LISIAGVEAIELRLGSLAKPGEPAGEGYIKFAELVERYSGGNNKIQLLLGASVCQETNCVESVLDGSLDVATVSNGNIGPFTNAFYWLDLPYIINDLSGLQKILLGPIGEEIRMKLEKENNLKVLAFMCGNGGFRVYIGKKPVRLPKDLTGMKVRAVNTPIEIAMWKSWGAIPTTIPFGEVYTGLSQGVIDGQGLQWTWADNSRHWEVAKHSTNVNYGVPVQIMIMRVDKFKALSQEVQELLMRAAKEAEQYNIRVNEQAMTTAEKRAKDNGVTFYELSAEEREIWKKTAPPIWKQFESKVSPEYVKKVIIAQD